MRTALPVLLALVLLDFLGLTVYVLASYGVVGWIPALVDSPLSILLTFDLLISLVIATVWMVQDARRRGVNPWPYVALTCATGSAGPLLYVITRLRAAPDTPLAA